MTESSEPRLVTLEPITVATMRESVPMAGITGFFDRAFRTGEALRDVFYLDHILGWAQRGAMKRRQPGWHGAICKSGNFRANCGRAGNTFFDFPTANKE